MGAVIPRFYQVAFTNLELTVKLLNKNDNVHAMSKSTN